VGIQFGSLPYLNHLGPALFRVMGEEKTETQETRVVGKEKHRV